MNVSEELLHLKSLTDQIKGRHLFVPSLFQWNHVSDFEKIKNMNYYLFPFFFFHDFELCIIPWAMADRTSSFFAPWKKQKASIILTFPAWDSVVWLFYDNLVWKTINAQSDMSFFRRKPTETDCSMMS